MLQENAAQEMLQENAIVGKRFFISKRQKKMDEIDGSVLERLASKLCAVVYEYDNDALQNLESFCNDDDNIRAFISRIEKADELCLESLDYQQALIKGETFMFPLPNYKSNRYMTYYLPETSKTPTGLRVEQLSKIEPDKKNILHF